MFYDLKRLHDNEYPVLNDLKKYQAMSEALEQSSNYYSTSDSGISWETGSEKQIAWADRIVVSFTSKAEALINEALEKNKITQEEAQKLANTLGTQIQFQDDANYWIDTRNAPIIERMREILSSKEDMMQILDKMA